MISLLQAAAFCILINRLTWCFQEPRITRLSEIHHRLVEDYNFVRGLSVAPDSNRIERDSIPEGENVIQVYLFSVYFAIAAAAYPSEVVSCS